MENSYEALMQGVQKILSGLERETLSVDELSEKAKEAYMMIDLLKKKLTETEAQVQEIIDGRS